MNFLLYLCSEIKNNNIMEYGNVKYGNVKFADIQVGSIVKVSSYYDQSAVGIVVEKTEKLKTKVVRVQFGFSKENIIVVLVEAIPDGGKPMYELLEIVRDYA